MYSCISLFIQVDLYFNDNRKNEARFASQMARKLNMAGFILGVIFWFLILITIIGFSTGLGIGLSEGAHDYYDDNNYS